MENKIITLRGTSGSGKTTLVKRLLSLYAKKEPVFVEKRKQPLYYVLTHENGSQLAVLGHYEIACGGCDTISDMDKVFDLVKEHAAVRNVLFEGLIVSSDVERTKALGKVHVVFMNTPVEECVASINLRRAARGVTEPVSPKNTEGKHRLCKRNLERFSVMPDITTYHLNREDAFNKVRELLGV